MAATQSRDVGAYTAAITEDVSVPQTGWDCTERMHLASIFMAGRIQLKEETQTIQPAASQTDTAPPEAYKAKQVEVIGQSSAPLPAC